MLDPPLVPRVALPTLARLATLPQRPGAARGLCGTAAKAASEGTLARRAKVPSNAAEGGKPRGADGAARLSAFSDARYAPSLREPEFLEALTRLLGTVRMHHQPRLDGGRAAK